jgi:small subunit ribosomal protein S2
MYQRIQELERMEKLFTTGEIERLTKKEALLIQREINRLNLRLSGVRSITRVPTMVFVVDVMREEAAVHEANLLGIPVVALVDTNCDPTAVDYVIPSNDDAIRAIKLLVSKMADAVLEGKAMRKDEEIATMEQVKAEVQAAVAEMEGNAGRDMSDDEMKDDELLGEATLAKLTPAPKVEETPIAPIAPVDETPTASVEEIPTTPVDETPATAAPEESGESK